MDWLITINMIDSENELEFWVLLFVMMSFFRI